VGNILSERFFCVRGRKVIKYDIDEKSKEKTEFNATRN